MSITNNRWMGYKGSHAVKFFLDENKDVILVDNLQSGHSESINVDYFYQIDLRDKMALDVFKKHNIEIFTFWFA